jgi:MscS family membrane protein
LRTAERTLVIIPNGKLADMRVESLGTRDRIRFATKLSLRRDTSPETIERIVSQLDAQLRAHKMLRTEEIFVRFSAIGESSFDVDVAAPVETRDPNEFAKIREALLIMCIRVVGESGATLAVPERALSRRRENLLSSEKP